MRKDNLLSLKSGVNENEQDSNKMTSARPSNISQDYKKNQTEVTKRISALKNMVTDDVHRGSTSKQA